MRTFAVVLGLFAMALVQSGGVQAQTGNYLLMSFDAATRIKEYYDDEIQYFRNYLTSQSESMGYYTEVVADALIEATTMAQGAGIESCAGVAAYKSRSSILYLEESILDAESTSRGLHTTVLNKLRNTNIYEEDLELFYYYHGYEMDAAYEALWEWYSEHMFSAWMSIYLDWYDTYDELYYCIADALYSK